MRHLARLTIASILIGLSFKAPAQDGKYVLLTRGQINPFDTAVAVAIDQYRKETTKLQLADAVIMGQDSLTRELIEKSRACDSVIAGMDLHIALLTQRLERKSAMLEASESDLQQSLDVIDLQENKLSSPFRKPWIWIAAGLGAGILIFR